MTRRLLYLSAHQMTAYSGHPGELTCEGLFAATEAGHHEFSVYLAQHAKCVFSILVNVAEEGFQIETIPFLHGADRKSIIRRKLGQLFFNAALTASQSLGFQKTKRKDERILLAALTNNELFAPWLNALSYAGVALSGIYSLPLLAPALLRKLRLSEERCLLLTVQDQSIRQSYFEKGELHFSRLTPLQNSSISGIAQSFSAETHKLQQYLAGQRLIGREQPITAHILAHSGALKTIQSSCVNTATIQYNFLSTEHCARKVGLKLPPAGTHCEQIFLKLLLTAPPRIQFADDDLRHDFHLRQIRAALHGIGALALFGGLLFAGSLLFETYHLVQQTNALRNESGLTRQRYNDILKTFPPIPINNETLRRVMDRYVELEKRDSAPDGLYREISLALQAAPAAELDSIDWKLGGLEPVAGQPAAAAVAGVVSRNVGIDSETAMVRGTLKLPASANARQMLAAFNVFVAALTARPNLQVDVLQRPFDIESGKSLKGGDTTLEDNKPRAFSLQITRKLGS